MKIQYKKITEITPYEKNPRKNDEAVDYVAKSIEEFGFKVPIVIDKNWCTTFRNQQVVHRVFSYLNYGIFG